MHEQELEAAKVIPGSILVGDSHVVSSGFSSLTSNAAHPEKELDISEYIGLRLLLTICPLWNCLSSDLSKAVPVRLLCSTDVSQSLIFYFVLPFSSDISYGPQVVIQGRNLKYIHVTLRSTMFMYTYKIIGFKG